MTKDNDEKIIKVGGTCHLNLRVLKRESSGHELLLVDERKIKKNECAGKVIDFLEKCGVKLDPIVLY